MDRSKLARSAIDTPPLDLSMVGPKVEVLTGNGGLVLNQSRNWCYSFKARPERVLVTSA